MKWSEIPKKERALIKGALRRVFSRSELRIKVLDAYATEHQDAKRPRVTRWVWCAVCGEVFPRYLATIDHISPVVPLDKATEDMDANELAERLWCAENNLQCIDPRCHQFKSKIESKARREFRKGAKNG